MPPIKPRSEVVRFSRQMERTLRLHDHKRHWRTLMPYQLQHRLEREVEELDAALDGTDRKAVVRECTDVANYAMMIADLVGGTGRWQVKR